MKYELRSIGFWSFVKIAFMVNFLAGMIAGVFLIPFGVILVGIWELGSIADPGGYVDDGSPMSGLVVLMPVIFAFGSAVIGTFFQSIVILVYNLLASPLGGLHLNLETSTKEPPRITPEALSKSVNPSDTSHRPAPPPPPPPPPPAGPREFNPDKPDASPAQPRVAPPAMNTYSPPPRTRPPDNEPENE